MSGSQASAPQAPQISKRVIEFLEELGFDVEKMVIRKCTDNDFVEMLTAVLLADGELYDYNIYSVDGWRILHVWVPGYGDDAVLLAKFEDYELEECFVVEEE